MEKRNDSDYPRTVLSRPHSPSGESPGITVAVAVAIIIALAAPLFFLGLGDRALSDPDEPYYAVPALEMLHTGSWQVPVFRGQPWFDKPILFYWMVLAAYKCFGVSEGAARLGSALAGLCGLLAVFQLGRRLGFTTRGALAASLMLATSLGYALAARAAITDMTLTLMVTAGMLATAGYLSHGGLGACLLAGAAFGLATLTKGPVGLLIPGVALCAYAVAVRRKELIRPAALAAGAVGCLLTAAPWYVYMALAHRGLLLDTFIGQGNLGRFLQPEHTTFHLYYLVVLAVGLLPWSGALPAALVRASMTITIAGAARAAERDRQRHLPPGPDQLLLVCWFGAVLLIFSIAASKLPTYVLPAFPPAALMIAAFWDRELAPGRHGPPARSAGAANGIGLIICLLSAAGVVYVTRTHGWDLVTSIGGAACAALLAGSILAAIATRSGSMKWFLIVQCGASAVAMILLLGVAMPRLEPYDSTRPLVRDLESRGLSGEVIATYKVADVSLDYYLGRSLSSAKRMKEVRDLVAQQPGRIWVVRTEDLDAIHSDTGVISEDVHRGPHRSAVRLSLATTAVPGAP
ncbi:MAG TPA: glycosyltransferase family 39 protein [Patescibacteria group bacterium]|nr:glycosyltransferase family 39 protein [Patescibacteria group bacterium]